MKTFLAVFTGTPARMDAWKALPEAERRAREAAGMKGWMEWAARHQAAIFDDGAPLGRTKRISAEGVADIRNALAAYTVVRAATHEEAAAMFEGHPHFAVFPGDGVEVMECLPIPDMAAS